MRIKDIPKDLLDQYQDRKMTSAQLSELTGFHPVSLRRAIKRKPVPIYPGKAKLIALRQAYRASIAHLTPTEISKLAHVSLSTANRIRKKYGNK